MSGLITFRHGPFRDWQLTLHSRWADGEMAHATVEITSPGGRDGLLAFRDGIDGWEQTWAAEMHGGPAAMAALLEWIVEATAVALDRRTDIPNDQRQHWQAIVAEADDSRATFFATYPGGTVPAFETVAALAYDGRTGELVAA